MFTGLSAFPLTPMRAEQLDERAFVGLVERLAQAGVDSIGALGSTGNYAYLTRSQRARIARLACEHSGDVPVIIGIGALRTADVLACAEDAQAAGAHGLLLPPMSYQPLRESEVFDLYRTVAASVSIPLCVYDNPTTTRFEFSDRLYARIAELPRVGSIKIPAVPGRADQVRARIANLRSALPLDVTLGISGDASAAAGLNGGCDAWYSVIGGLFPATAQAITRAALESNAAEASRLSEALAPLWTLYARHGGSLRVIATAAEVLGLVAPDSLPLPLQSLSGADRQAVETALQALNLC